MSHAGGAGGTVTMEVTVSGLTTGDRSYRATWAGRMWQHYLVTIAASGTVNFDGDLGVRPTDMSVLVLFLTSANTSALHLRNAAVPADVTLEIHPNRPVIVPFDGSFFDTASNDLRIVNSGAAAVTVEMWLI